MVALTKPQLAALRMVAAGEEGCPGVLAVHRLPGRMVHCYRVAHSLVDKSLVTWSRTYLTITDAGRAALAESKA